MKAFIRRLIELTGYTPVKLSVLKDPNKQKPLTREHFFDLYFAKADPNRFFFVQIGASDGKSVDPLYPYVTRYCLRGVGVEPQPYAFALLRETYREHPNVQLVEAAIADRTGTRPFFAVKTSARTPENRLAMSRIGSFQKSSILKTLEKKIPRGADPESYLEVITVPTLSFNDLVLRCGIDHVDLLQIDAEGYDYEILKTIDFARFSPEVIVYESGHLGVDREASEELLERLGYQVFRSGIDTVAYRFNA